MSIPDGLALGLALIGLALTLAVAVAQPPWGADALVAVAVSCALIAVGAIRLSRARDAVDGLGSTVGFLAALLLLADGCRRQGLFEALGELMGRGSRDRPTRMLALVFAVSVAVTAVLGLDSTIVLLTPIVFTTATRLRIRPKPHVYACAHFGELGIAFAARVQSDQPACIPREWLVIQPLRNSDGVTYRRCNCSRMGRLDPVLRGRAEPKEREPRS